jgi:hypothetical protein
METQNSGTSMSTERSYNLEFCKGLLNHPRVKEGEELRLFDLLVVAERISGRGSISGRRSHARNRRKGGESV